MRAWRATAHRSSGSGHAVGAAARRASHPQIPRRTPSRGRGRAAGTARVRREARGGVGGGGGAGGGGHGAGARGWWRARHPRALRGRRSDSHACGQRRRVVRRAASRRARCARGRRALVGDSSPSEERGAGAGASRDARSLKSPSQTRKTNAFWPTLGSTLSLPSVLGARPRPRPRTGPATCRANWLVGGGAASPSDRRKQCMQLCAQSSWRKQMHARC